VSAFVIWHILRVQGERFRPMNGFRVEATDNFRFENLLRSSQGRWCHGLDPNRFVIRINTEKRCFTMLHCISQRQSSVLTINMSNSIILVSYVLNNMLLYVLNNIIAYIIKSITYQIKIRIKRTINKRIIKQYLH